MFNKTTTKSISIAALIICVSLCFDVKHGKQIQGKHLIVTAVESEGVSYIKNITRKRKCACF